MHSVDNTIDTIAILEAGRGRSDAEKELGITD